MEIKIRNLTVGDNRFLIRLINKLIKEYKENWIKDLIKPNKNKTEKPTKKETDEEVNDNIDDETSTVFLSIINSLIDHYTTEITEWFASLLSITPEEYDKLDFDTDAIVIDQIINQPKFKFFFQRVSAAFSQVKNLGDLLNIGKKK